MRRLYGVMSVCVRLLRVHLSQLQVLALPLAIRIALPIHWRRRIRTKIHV